MKYFKMLRKLFSSVFFFGKNNKKPESLNSQKKSTQQPPSSFSTNLEDQKSSLNTVLDHKFISDGKEDRTIISDSMLKESRLIIDHNETVSKHKITVNDDISQNDDDDDDTTILDQSVINRINTRISNNNKISDDDKTYLHHSKIEDQDDDKTYLHHSKIKDQNDDITIFCNDQFSNNASKKSRN
jgi:hypothetical protein